jgi:hypothetical protein
MSKGDLKDVRGWIKDVRKFVTGTRYGYHPQLDLATICIQKYLHDINGGLVHDASCVHINGTEVNIGDILRELRQDNCKSNQRLNAIGRDHENLNRYLNEETMPGVKMLKNMITIMTDEIKADIDIVKAEIELTLQKAK